MKTLINLNSNGTATFGNILLGKGSFSQPKYEPCIIQSAFIFDNGIRIIVFTSNGQIRSFECDINWKPNSKPFGGCPLSWSEQTATEYHLELRNKIHKPENFVKEHSTEINW